MQASLWWLTTPVTGSLRMALTGQADTQPASTQCMQWRLTKA